MDCKAIIRDCSLSLPGTGGPGVIDAVQFILMAHVSPTRLGWTQQEGLFILSVLLSCKADIFFFHTAKYGVGFLRVFFSFLFFFPHFFFLSFGVARSPYTAINYVLFNSSFSFRDFCCWFILLFFFFFFFVGVGLFPFLFFFFLVSDRALWLKLTFFACW